MKEILLDIDRVIYYPGETIKGEVLIRLDKTLSSRGLKLNFKGIKVDGYYDKWSDEGDYITVYYPFHIQSQKLWTKEAIPPGEHHIPFSVDIPEDAPASCKSTYYRLMAWIDVPWRFNLKCKQRICVHSQTPVRGPEEQKPLSLGTIKIPGDEPPTFSLLERLGRPRTLKMVVFLDRGLYYPGEDIDLKVFVINPKEKRLRKLNVILSTSEISIAKGQDDQVLKGQARTSIPLDSIGPRHELEGKIKIPATGPSTFSAKNCNLVWELKLELDVAWGFNTKLKLEVPIYQLDPADPDSKKQ